MEYTSLGSRRPGASNARALALPSLEHIPKGSSMPCFPAGLPVISLLPDGPRVYSSLCVLAHPVSANRHGNEHILDNGWYLVFTERLEDGFRSVCFSTIYGVIPDLPASGLITPAFRVVYGYYVQVRNLVASILLWRQKTTSFNESWGLSRLWG